MHPLAVDHPMAPSRIEKQEEEEATTTPSNPFLARRARKSVQTGQAPGMRSRPLNRPTRAIFLFLFLSRLLARSWACL